MEIGIMLPMLGGIRYEEKINIVLIIFCWEKPFFKQKYIYIYKKCTFIYLERCPFNKPGRFKYD